MAALTKRLHFLLDRYNYLKDRDQKQAALYYKGRADEVQRILTELDRRRND